MNAVIIISVHRIYFIDMFAFASCLLQNYAYLYAFAARVSRAQTAFDLLRMRIRYLRRHVSAILYNCSDLCAPHKRWQSQFVCC